jgi:hypothetical protein
MVLNSEQNPNADDHSMRRARRQAQQVVFGELKWFSYDWVPQRY